MTGGGMKGRRNVKLNYLKCHSLQWPTTRFPLNLTPCRLELQAYTPHCALLDKLSHFTPIPHMYVPCNKRHKQTQKTL